MRCSNCGKDTPFLGDVCHWCNSKKSKDRGDYILVGLIVVGVFLWLIF